MIDWLKNLIDWLRNFKNNHVEITIFIMFILFILLWFKIDDIEAAWLVTLGVVGLFWDD
jgi:hypothetical protein